MRCFFLYARERRGGSSIPSTHLFSVSIPSKHPHLLPLPPRLHSCSEVASASVVSSGDAGELSGSCVQRHYLQPSLTAQTRLIERASLLMEYASAGCAGEIAAVTWAQFKANPELGHFEYLQEQSKVVYKVVAFCPSPLSLCVCSRSSHRI